MKDIKLIVNTTPLGMYPNIDTMPKLDYDYLNSGHILFDVVYNPEITAFLKRVKKKGVLQSGNYNVPSSG